MGERLNFICLGNRTLDVHEYRMCIQGVLSCLKRFKPEVLEVMRVDVRSGIDAVAPWDASATLVEIPLDADILLVTYFVVSNDGIKERQSVTIDIRDGCSVVTLSLDPLLVKSSNVSASTVLAGLAGWTIGMFDFAVLVCGLELDLYEMRDEQDFRKIEERLSSDWRCLFGMTTRRIQDRRADFPSPHVQRQRRD